MVSTCTSFPGVARLIKIANPLRRRLHAGYAHSWDFQRVCSRWREVSPHFLSDSLFSQSTLNALTSIDGESAMGSTVLAHSDNRPDTESTYSQHLFEYTVLCFRTERSYEAALENDTVLSQDAVRYFSQNAHPECG